MYARTVAFLSIFAVSACGGSTFTPQGSDAIDAPTSAVRVPTSVLASLQRRHPASLTASAAPLTALAWPLTALAWPLTALPWPGQTATLSSVPCAASNSSAKKHNSEVQCKVALSTGAPIVTAVNPAVSSLPGVVPGLLQYIYDLPSSGGAGQTVAAVVALDDPNAEADLAIYRSEFGLSPCTTANGCFRKIVENGAPLPVPDAGWSLETALDLDAISAACAQCNILLVEAVSDQIPDLAAAADTAVASGATVVNNSYGVAEAADNVLYASHYEHPGIPMTAAAGDVGFGPQFPASVPSVTAVGGTSIVRYGNSGIAEVAWPLTGAGCSAFFPKPTWQHDTGCTTRTLNDVAMISDPLEGLTVYDSTLPGTTAGGWTMVGGTSLSSILAASLFALEAQGGAVGSNAGIYAAVTNTTPELIDVTAGSDGSCTIAYLCTAQTNYDGPTGNGVPWGAGAFAPIQ